MYQRSSPGTPADISDVHAVVRELAGVLARQPAAPAPEFKTVPIGTGAAAGPVPANLADADDAQMPIPSTWRDPNGIGASPVEVAPWRTGFLGLIVGLCLTLPSVLWLTGHLAGPMAWFGIARVETVAKAPTAAFTAEIAWPVSAGRGAAEPVSSDGSTRAPPSGNDSPTGMLTTAELLIAGGDIVLARNLLETSAASGSAEILFALAETYDPNMLAAWGVRDLRADSSQARSLYERALAGGIGKARHRLQGLQ